MSRQTKLPVRPEVPDCCGRGDEAKARDAFTLIELVLCLAVIGGICWFIVGSQQGTTNSFGLYMGAVIAVAAGALIVLLRSGQPKE